MLATGTTATSSEGARQGLSWPREGLVKFNQLSKMVKHQCEMQTRRKKEERTHAGRSPTIMAWCSNGAGMPEMVTSSSGLQWWHPREVEEEEEVEAMGECGIF
jgi:hypothetical protein